ncbi:monodechloroaminopyrrolnitrin synthase PrnB family protein [Streptomyces tsukubensis]|uniref:monodechloroaminopyrrolnitrin synthase PrnB family protein n=1 Tax=Streptomyces tsukubensis TaxID=83656 RepID=UPI00344DF7E3
MSLAMRMRALDQHVAALDPLGTAPDIFRLPMLNRGAATDEIARLGRLWLSRVGEAVHDIPTASAALRDLGFALASLERHGVDYRTLEGAEETLLKLGGIADEVPRDSVYTYALRNPEQGTRSFSEIPEEALFIREVRRAGIALRPAIDALVEALPLAADDPELPALLDTATQGFETFAHALLQVKREVTPECFSYELRPYFPPMTVGGEVLFAPGGAQMTPMLVDIILLRPEPGDRLEEWYEGYLAENIGYLPASYRAIGSAAGHHRPLLPRLVEEAGRAGGADTRMMNAIRALRGLMHEVLRFRLPHLRLAKANMNIRPSGSLGSGGYTTDSLDHLADLTVGRQRLLAAVPDVSARTTA